MHEGQASHELFVHSHVRDSPEDSQYKVEIRYYNDLSLYYLRGGHITTAGPKALQCTRAKPGQGFLARTKLDLLVKALRSPLHGKGTA